MIFRSTAPPLSGPSCDDLTIVQFMLDAQHRARPLRTSDTPWCIDDDTGVTRRFEEIRARTYGLANALAGKYGIRENDVVCLYSPNQLDYTIAVWAAHRLGAVVSPANPMFTESELEYQIQVTKSTLIITHTSCLHVALKSSIPSSRILLFSPVGNTGSSTPANGAHAMLDDLINWGLSTKPHFTERRLNPGEGKTKLALLCFSSGTTGRPKAVAIQHHAVISNILQAATTNGSNDPSIPWEERRFKPGDVVISVLPLFHGYGLITNFWTMIFCGLTTVVITKFDFPKMLDSIYRYKITHLFLVPPQAVLLCKHPAVKRERLSHVRYCMVGAAPMTEEIQVQLRELMPQADMGQALGTTETAVMISMEPLSQKPQGTIGASGQLISSTEAKILLPDGRFGGPGEAGELCIRGPQLTLGYYNNEEATKATFKDGWLHTGDKAIISANGDLYIIDRIKEIMKVRGFQVAPAELEGHLLDMPDVGDACVIGVPDDYSGEVPMAYVVLSEQAKERYERDPKAEGPKIKEAIKKHVSSSKTRYKWLDGGVEFIDAIPKTPSGKILRRLLRDQAKASRLAPKL